MSRDQAVPCVNATRYEINEGRHLTWNDDRVCQRCNAVMDTFRSRIALNTQVDQPKENADGSV